MYIKIENCKKVYYSLHKTENWHKLNFLQWNYKSILGTNANSKLYSQH